MNRKPMTLAKATTLFKNAFPRNTGVYFDSVKEKTVVDGERIIKYWTVTARLGTARGENLHTANPKMVRTVETDVENAMLELSYNTGVYARQIVTAMVLALLGVKVTNAKPNGQTDTRIQVRVIEAHGLAGKQGDA